MIVNIVNINGKEMVVVIGFYFCKYVVICGWFECGLRLEVLFVGWYIEVYGV